MTTTFRFFPAFLVGGMLLASWRTASGQEQPQGGLEAPVETPAAEAAPEEKPGERSRPGILGRGIRSVLGAFSGGRAEREGPEAGGAEPGEKSSSDETQKKVNELTRVAHMNIDKGRIPEAIKNVNDLISLKPYEADFHLALGLCLRKEGKYGDALKKYQDVLDLGGPRALIALLKAEAYGAENKPDKVFEHLKEAAIGGRNIINDVRMLPLLSSYQQDTEFIKLALQLEKVAVSVARHHDPFTNPFPTADPQKAGGEAAEAPNTLTPEEQEKLLQEARKTYERVQFYIKLEDEAKAMKAYTSLREMIKKKELLTVPKIVNELRILIGRLEKLEIEIEGIRLRYYVNQAQAKLKQMKDLFSDAEYQQVEVLHGEVGKLTQEMEQANARYKPVADQILALSNRWLARAKVRQDFEARKPSIQGIVIADDMKMAVLNDRVVKQGEAVEDFRVVKVESNRVTFRYKGEEIPLVFRRY